VERGEECGHRRIVDRGEKSLKGTLYILCKYVLWDRGSV